MFGHDSKPARNLKFGCRSPEGKSAELVREQMRLAHKYRNRLVEIELARREVVAAALRELAPDVLRLETETAELDAKREAAALMIRSANAGARKKIQTPAQRSELATMRESLRELRAKLKAAKRAVFESPEWTDRQAEIESVDNAKRKTLRSEYADSLAWGTRAVVEQSASAFRRGAPPKFHRWTGDGKIAVQLQGGMSIDDLLGCSDTRLRLARANGERETIVAKNGRTVERRLWDKVSIRVGSQGRDPIWADLDCRIHRDFPEDCRVKWAYVICRRVATREEWSLIIVVDRAGGFPHADASAGGIVGIDVGWRQVPGGLRVASWTGDDGSDGELILPMDDVGRWSQAERLQSIRDIAFAPVLAQVADWLDQRRESLPEEWTERARAIRLWRSPARLAALAIWWREHRLPDDGEILTTAELWRRQDKHLYDWQESQRAKAIRWRDDVYRNFAADLRRRYRTAAIEDCDWSDLMRRQTEESVENDAGMREYMRIASVGRLMECVRESLSKTVRVDPQYTTDTCHACGKRSPFDAANELRHTCTHCGANWDQDYNAARNLLAAASGLVESEAL